MLLEVVPERARHPISAGDGKPDLLAVIHSRTERKHRNLVAVQAFVDGVHRNLEDDFVLHFVTSSVRSVSGGARIGHSVVNAVSALHCARVRRIEASGEHFAQLFGDPSLF